VFFLAIDSAMSLVEAVWVAVRDKFKNLKTEYLTAIIVIVLWLSSLVYMFGNWLYVLDIVDHFVTSYSMLFIWILEAVWFVILWKKLWNFIDENNECLFRKIINKWYFILTWLLSILVLWFLLYKNVSSWLDYGGYDKSYLIMYWIYTLIWIYAISILLNILDRKEK
jgi:NSS family neurotransmitter:Na+ symporter